MIRNLITDFGDVAVANFVGELRESDPEEFRRWRDLVEQQGDELIP